LSNGISCFLRTGKPGEGECTDYAAEGIDARYLQASIFEGPRTDIDPLTGNRRETSFPNISTSPETTEWWSDVNDLPGSSKGTSAAGYETTYDRVRTLSALSAIHAPLYNYVPPQDSKVRLGSWVGLEADGMVCFDGQTVVFWTMNMLLTFQFIPR